MQQSVPAEITGYHPHRNAFEKATAVMMCAATFVFLALIRIIPDKSLAGIVLQVATDNGMDEAAAVYMILGASIIMSIAYGRYIYRKMRHTIQITVVFGNFFVSLVALGIAALTVVIQYLLTTGYITMGSHLFM